MNESKIRHSIFAREIYAQLSGLLNIPPDNLPCSSTTRVLLMHILNRFILRLKLECTRMYALVNKIVQGQFPVYVTYITYKSEDNFHINLGLQLKEL